MDDKTNTGHPYERSDEEVSWDAEFANMEQKRASGYPQMLNDVSRMITQAPGAVARMPGAVARMPMEILPDETAVHAKAAVREGFLALRSLVAAIADTIESMLGESTGKKATVSGPPGTWGTGRSGGTGSTPPGKARRIEVSDEVGEKGGTGEGTVSIDDLGDQEGRGLRADIDY